MKVAFVGASHWHLFLYLEPMREIADVDVVAMSDPDPLLVNELARQHECKGFTDYRDLCAAVRPDFVIVLGKHSEMVETALFLIGQGIPFALEKPCGLDQQQILEIAALAERKSHFVAVPLVFRHGDYFKRLQDLSVQGVHYLSFRFIAGLASRYINAKCDWMLDPVTAGGGCNINLGIHFYDICHCLFGDGAEVKAASMSNAAWGYPVEDYALVSIGRGRALCTIETGYLFPAPTNHFDMHYSARFGQDYLVAHDPETIEITNNDGHSHKAACLTTNVPHYRTFVHDVIRRVRAGQQPVASLADMVPVMRLVDQSYRMANPCVVVC
jgi:hypothetical protein